MLKKKEEVKNENIGKNHFQTLLGIMEKMSDPNLKWKQVPSGNGRFLTLKMSDSEKIGSASYLIPIFNKLVDEILEHE